MIKIIKDQLAKSVWLGQQKLFQFGMNDCKSIFTPLDVIVKFYSPNLKDMINM
jgi:hypothetical protein